MSTTDAKLNAFVRTKGRARRPPAIIVICGLLGILLLTVLLAATVGAAGIPVSRLPAALGVTAADPGNTFAARDQLILWSIRIPRIAIAAMIGGMLGAAGAIMQGLFRNPLADPRWSASSSGGAFAAAAAIVSVTAGSHITLYSCSRFCCRWRRLRARC